MNVGLWDVAAVVIKAITYAATFGVTGGVLFLAYSARLILTQHDHAIRRWVMGCAVAAIVGSLLRISVLAASMAESAAGMLDTSMLTMVLQAGEVRPTGLRAMGLVLVLLFLNRGRRLTAVALVGALAASASFAWVGHAWASGARAPLVAVESVHLICGAFWLGALPPLRRIANDGNLTLLASVATRFGHLAFWVVALLIVAGATVLARLLGSAAELWSTGYGQLVIAKLSAVVALLGLATLNRWRLTPRLLADDRRAMLSLTRSIDAEMAVGAIVLFVTAALTTVTGPAALE